MGEIRIRAPEPADAEAIAEIFDCPGVIRGTLQLPFRTGEERRARMLEPSPDVFRLVAEVDGWVVGMLSLHLERSARWRHAGSIGMAVHDDFQGQGIGTALMVALVDLSDRWLGLHRIELQVFTDNAAAIHLYEKFGFVIEGTQRDFAFQDGRYVDAYAMARLRR